MKKDEVAGNAMLKAGGLLSGLIALVHVVIIGVGAPAYRYFGAGEGMAQLSEQGSWSPGLVTAVLTAIFVAWALYAFAGAQLIRRLPLLRLGLLAIGTLYALRGVLLGPQLVWHFSGAAALVPSRLLVFSAVSLVTGVLYLGGTLRAWSRLSPRPTPGLH